MRVQIILWFMEFSLLANREHDTAQKMRFSIKDFFSKCDQIRSFLRIWSHLLKKSLLENLIFYVKGPATLLKKRLWHRYFPLNFAKFLRTRFLTEDLCATASVCSPF